MREELKLQEKENMRFFGAMVVDVTRKRFKRWFQLPSAELPSAKIMWLLRISHRLVSISLPIRYFVSERMTPQEWTTLC